MSDFRLLYEPRLSRSTIERAASVRNDDAQLKQKWGQAKCISVDDSGRFLTKPAGDLGRSSSLTVVREPTEKNAPSSDAVFLGTDSGVHIWARPVEEFTNEHRERYSSPNSNAVPHSLMQVADDLNDSDVALISRALALLHWHRKSNGEAVIRKSASGGWVRVNSEGEHEFPRTDPAVICLVHDGADHVLLARQHTWPPHRRSILAGFIEAGESLEQCVEREIAEEVGLKVSKIQYLGSQPWPFPRSLMIGFHAVADRSAELDFTDDEIESAHWFSVDDVLLALRAEHTELKVPGSLSIARVMLESWAQWRRPETSAFIPTGTTSDH